MLSCRNPLGERERNESMSWGKKDRRKAIESSPHAADSKIPTSLRFRKSIFVYSLTTAHTHTHAHSAPS